MALDKGPGCWWRSLDLGIHRWATLLVAPVSILAQKETDGRARSRSVRLELGAFTVVWQAPGGH